MQPGLQPTPSLGLLGYFRRPLGWIFRLHTELRWVGPRKGRMKTLKLSCDQGSSPPHLLSCCLSRGWENGTRFSEKGHTWRVSHMEGLPSSRLLLVLTACNQHLSWLSLMMSSTVPLVAHVSSVSVLSCCIFSLLLVLEYMDILLRNVPAYSHSCHPQFLEPSYMSTIIHSNCSLELSYSPQSLWIAMGPSV